MTNTDFTKKLEEYAQTVVKIGIQVKSGQIVVIDSPVECSEFARMCMNAAYDAGASEVVMSWSDELSENIRISKSSLEVLDNPPQHTADLYNNYAKKGALFLRFYSPSKFHDDGIDRKRLLRYTKAKIQKTQYFNDAEKSNTVTWSVCGVPNKTWAHEVFSDIPVDDAMAKLWEAIFNTARVKGDGKSIERWHEHLSSMEKRVKILNEMHLTKLHYTNDVGSDFTIELPKNHKWTGAESINSYGNSFVANIPTEEIFTAPHRNGINGTIVSSKPLLMDGSTITGLKFVVKDGKIIKEYADRGMKALKSKLDADKGSRYFGEVALVPYDSPISNLGLTFINTLYDENASCHLAFGFGFPECIHGGEKMSSEELFDAGINQSDTHIDFMVGTKDLSIIGTKPSGEEVEIFKNGNFAF